MLPRQYARATQTLEHSALLPFLYQTRTIRRQYVTARQGAVDDASDSMTQKPKRQRQRSREGRASGNECQRRPYSQRENDRSSGGERVDFVPFEGRGGLDAHAELDGSTITPRERKAFEGLFRLKQQRSEDAAEEERAPKEKETRAETSRSKRERSALDDIMDPESKEGQLSSATLEPLAKEGPEQRTQQRKSPAQRVAFNNAAKTELREISRLFDAAQTDVEVWNILQQKVFSRVIALNLDSPSPKPIKPKTSKANASKKDSKPPVHTDLDVLTLTLPHHLISATRTLTQSFPASPLPLALLPHLRHLGPTAFALGTSTPLYNQHMRLLALRHGDIDGIVSTLKEMDAQVYAFDGVSEEIVEGVLARRGQVHRGVWGSGLDSWWRGEGMRRRVGRLVGWAKKVRGRREEEALRRARNEEALRVAEREEIAGEVEK